MSVNVTMIKRILLLRISEAVYLSEREYRDPVGKNVCLWMFFQSSSKDYLGQVLQMAI